MVSPERRAGWVVNHKRAHRIWKQEDLSLPRKRPHRGVCGPRGKVEMAKLMEAISYAHQHCESSLVSQVLEPVNCNMLMLEVIPASTKSEDNLLRELAKSHDYLRQFVPNGGITLTV